MGCLEGFLEFLGELDEGVVVVEAGVVDDAFEEESDEPFLVLVFGLEGVVFCPADFSAGF